MPATLTLPPGGNQITITNTPKSLVALIRTAAGNGNYEIPDGFNSVTIYAEDDIRYLVGDTAPTPSAGLVIAAGQTIDLKGINLSKLQLIRAGAANATANLSIYQSPPRL